MKERVDGKANPSWKDSLLHLYLLRVDYDKNKNIDKKTNDFSYALRHGSHMRPGGEAGPA